MGRRRLEQCIEVPKGIAELRKLEGNIKGHPEIVLRPEEFKQAITILDACAEGAYPHLVKCEICFYKEECHNLQDYISGKVYVKVKKHAKN